MAKDNKKLFKSVDIISKELDAVDNFVLKYWKLYVYIAIGIVVAVFAVTIFIRLYEHSGFSASRELASAVTLEEMQKAVKSNPSNPLTGYVELKAVSQFIKNNDIEGAKKACLTIISSSKDAYAVARAKLDLAYIAEIMGNNEEAVRLFSQNSDSGFFESIKAEGLYNSGRIYLAMGKKDQAFDALKKCSAIPASSSVGWQEFANKLINSIN